MRARGGWLQTRPIALCGALVLAVLLVGCTNTPPPPLVSSPSTVASSTPTEPARQLTVGVSSVAGGYNPHNLADQSTVTTALAQLLLPSVFRSAADGSPELDRTVMRWAEVTNADPFTVTYQVRGDASWSDSAPIAAEDFVYLWQQMRNSPGVVEPTGYQLITDISSTDGGKRVEVTFAEPYPGWRTLFQSLLPAHLLKDAPGGWSAALAESFPAYGGPFAIKSLDAARGEIILERNERYWEQPAMVDQLVLRRADQSGIVSALGSGNDQLALVGTDSEGKGELAALGDGIELFDVPQPTVASVLLRPIGEVFTDERVRSAIASLLDRNALIEAGADGGPSAKLRADSLVRAPSSPGYRATMPGDVPAASQDNDRARRLLTEAGYQWDGESWLDDEGDPLRLTIAAPEGVAPYTSVAEELRDQLSTAGIDVTLRSPDPRALYGDQLNTPSVPLEEQTETTAPGPNIVVGPQGRGGDPASVLAQTFGCRAIARSDDSDAAPDAPPANAAAFCDPELQPSISAALTGRLPLAEVLARVEPRLWRQSVVIPLFQLADNLAVRPDVSEVDPGPPLDGPFAGATTWRRTSG
ncbi:ABC-type transport system substrate-binding protein [Tamaricihabitans halophyticus]|uniref:ABC-type transport system substrate-binding protein n=1 Tax=Tamaricihabitans halophyticus TaxID=1262583 RepID=A0A4R2R3G7_9PSEU|nr:ABC transporter family substrate-binding protein [Tamaricihabitans halophyticus]TCP56249.1 ABC-type transport system substrate-binding protein [Tamaricihabitans halophyticus]